MSYKDKTLICSDCGSRFTFTAGEQEFHASKGFTNEPRRCPDCRTARRIAGGDSSGARTSYGGERQLFTATCAACGREARVPFAPRGDKPVYCSDCFRGRAGGNRPSYGAAGSRGGRW